MTLLIISPDYASHATPLVTIGRAWRDAGERVVVATGPAVAPLVVGAGMEFERLSLGRGFNAGVARPDDQPRGEDVGRNGGLDWEHLGLANVYGLATSGLSASDGTANFDDGPLVFFDAITGKLRCFCCSDCSLAHYTFFREENVHIRIVGRVS